MSKNNYEIKKVEYTKENGEVSSRDVIIISQPKNLNLMALEVTDLPQEQRDELRNTLLRHKQELDALKPQWKNFKPDNLIVLGNV